MTLQYQAPIVQKPRDRHTASIIMLHGLGDSGAAWADFGAEYGSTLPHVKWIFPNAPTVDNFDRLRACLPTHSLILCVFTVKLKLLSYENIVQETEHRLNHVISVS